MAKNAPSCLNFPRAERFDRISPKGQPYLALGGFLFAFFFRRSCPQRVPDRADGTARAKHKCLRACRRFSALGRNRRQNLMSTSSDHSSLVQVHPGELMLRGLKSQLIATQGNIPQGGKNVVGAITTQDLQHIGSDVVRKSVQELCKWGEPPMPANRG